jgi:hypothetical protein
MKEDKPVILCQNSYSILSILGIVFVVLKLCGIICWSWWWVLAPFWMPFALLIILVIVLSVLFRLRV